MDKTQGMPALLVPPLTRDRAPTQREALPAGLQARVWIGARCFFSRESAQESCWLWLLDNNARVHALRLAASCHGRDDLLPALLARLGITANARVAHEATLSCVCALPRAPVVPLPRWAISWGHPVQAAIRAFAALLDGEVLAALGRLEVPGPFFGSVENYNRLTMLPQPTRRHRLQALGEFPPLVAPILLDRPGRPAMFDAGDDAPPRPMHRDETRHAAALDAMDRGRDLVGALAAYHRIGRALVRSPLFRAPIGEGCASRKRLRLLDAIPAHARPRDRASLEAWLPSLDALSVEPSTERDIARLARVFAPGWERVWRALDRRFRPLVPALRDSRDFLRAARDWVDLPPELAGLDTEMLALAWLCRRGPASLLEASRRWHAEPIVEVTADDGLPEGVTPLLGELTLAEGSAHEVTSREGLLAEGESMHHCVGGYWATCALDATRIVHLKTSNGETATAQYDCDANIKHTKFRLVELRGSCNQEPSAAMRRFAARIEEALNASERETRREALMHEMRELRACHRPFARERPLRPLDRRSRRELRLVLAWCRKQDDWLTRPGELFRGPIAGFAHANGARLLDELGAGDALELVHEPDNPYDALAVRVDWHGHKLGYVPRPHNEAVARRLDTRAPTAATIRVVRPDEEPWLQAEIVVLAGGA